MLRSINNEFNDGTIFSLFQILENDKNFINLSKQILTKKKILVFCLENIIVTDFLKIKLILKKLKINKFSNIESYHINSNSLKILKRLLWSKNFIFLCLAKHSFYFIID